METWIKFFEAIGPTVQGLASLGLIGVFMTLYWKERKRGDGLSADLAKERKEIHLERQDIDNKIAAKVKERADAIGMMVADEKLEYKRNINEKTSKRVKEYERQKDKAEKKYHVALTEQKLKERECELQKEKVERLEKENARLEEQCESFRRNLGIDKVVPKIVSEKQVK